MTGLDNNLVKYALLFNMSECLILLEEKIDNDQEIQDEKQRVIDRVVKAKLQPNERKKILSKKNGKWLCLSDEQGMLGIVLLHEDYPDRVGYKMIGSMLTGIDEILGENYMELPPKKVEALYKEKQKRIVKKYSAPEEFDTMMKAQRKVIYFVYLY